MRIKARDAGQVRVLDLNGKLLLGHGETALEEAVNSALAEGHRRIVFNMEKVPFIDSAGTGALTMCMKRALDQKAEIKLMIPPSSTIHLHVQTCLRLMFKTFDDEAEAVESFLG